MFSWAEQMDVLSQARASSRTPRDELDYSMHNLIQHNAATPPYEEYHSALARGNAEELKDNFAAYTYGHGFVSDDMGAHHGGLAGHVPVYYEAAYPRTSSPYVQPSPLTPQSTPSDPGVRTRSGRKVGAGNLTAQSRTSSKSRRSKSPMPTKKAAKAAKSAKSEKLKTPKLTEPISVLTKDMDVPVKDMDAWVNRSVEVRLKEVEDRKGYVTRPMNSFMLYRSAYAERLKQWGVHNNHQVVSSMAGESWPLEPPEIREHYNELAKIERTNHQSAHPNYKFSPSKGANPKKRKGDNYESEEETFTETDNPDGDWEPGNRRTRGKRRNVQDESHVDSQDMRDANAYGLYSAAWPPTSHAKPLPRAINDVYSTHHAYHQPAYVTYGMLESEAVRRRELDRHRTAYPVPMAQPLVGLPGGQHSELLHTGFGTMTPSPGREPQMDNVFFSNQDVGLFDNMRAEYEPAPAPAEYAIPADFLGTGFAEWQVDPSLQPLETENEFDKWT